MTFINDDVLKLVIMKNFNKIDAAFIDPDWADTGPDHVYRFTNSNTIPPADLLLNKTFQLTKVTCFYRILLFCRLNLPLFEKSRYT